MRKKDGMQGDAQAETRGERREQKKGQRKGRELSEAKPEAEAEAEALSDNHISFIRIYTVALNYRTALTKDAAREQSL
jgi:hypothetical protein